MLSMPATTRAGSRRPVAYIRRSKVEADSPGNISRETQLAAIAARASIDGASVAPADILEDWGRSGRGSKVAGRKAFATLQAMVAADQVSAVYAYNWSRLGRSTRDILALADLCKAHGTAIITATGQSVDPSTADGRMLLTILTAVDEWQAEVQSERTAGVLQAWREANPGEVLGRKRYGQEAGESVQVVLDAFDGTGDWAGQGKTGFLGAAKRLNAAGIPTALAARGGRATMGWDARTVSRIIRKARPEMGEAGKKGVSVRATRIFAGLIRCSCGDVMTSMPRAGSVGYYCKRAHLDPSHPRPYVIAEPKVIAYVKPTLDAADIRVGRHYGAQAEDTTARRLALQAKRAGIGDAYMAGAYGAPGSASAKAEMGRRVAEVEADLSKVEATGWTGSILAHLSSGGPLVDFTADPADVNAVLRRLWASIDLTHVPNGDGTFRWADTAHIEWQPGAYETFVQGGASEDAGR